MTYRNITERQTYKCSNLLCNLQRLFLLTALLTYKQAERQRRTETHTRMHTEVQRDRDTQIQTNRQTRYPDQPTCINIPILYDESGCPRQVSKVRQPHLRTRRCVGFRISSHPAFKFPWSYEFPLAFGCNRIFHRWGTCRNNWRQVHSCRSRFCHNYFFIFLFLYPLRHRFGAANQAGILSAASRAEMADVEQMKKIVSFVTCEITFGQNVCDLMFGINVSDLDFGIHIDPIKQLIQSNFVGPWYMSHFGTPVFYYHLNHGFIVLKDIQHSTGNSMCSAWWNVINVSWIEIDVRDWNLCSHVWLSISRQVSPWPSYIFGFVGLLWYRMKYFNYQITKNKSGNTIHA